MTRPITPDEAGETRAIPPEVLEAFNQLIKQNMRRGVAHVGLNEVAKLAAVKLDCRVEYLFDHDLLDVENAYRQAGWVVEYDQPGYNEEGQGVFTFRRPRPSSPDGRPT